MRYDEDLSPEANQAVAMLAIAEAIDRFANCVMPSVAHPAEDATGGYVASIGEAMMGMTAGLVRIADAIDRLAESVESVDIGSEGEPVHIVSKR